MAPVHIFIFLIGLSLGSFLNVILWRLNKEQGIATGRSQCPFCRHKLSWYDLIPLISYLILRGHCRHCQHKIPLSYPLVELTTGILLLLFAINTSLVNIDSIFKVIFLLAFIALLFFDQRYYILPDKITLPLIALALLRITILYRLAWQNMFIAGLALTGVFAILYFGSKGRWMGFGDVKLALAIGLIFGYPLGFFEIVFSIWVAAIFGIILLLFGKAKLKSALPFGTFISAVAIIFILFENEIQILNNIL